MEWSETFKAYLEVGILGLCSILVIVTSWLNFKKLQENSDKNNDKIDKKDTNLESNFNDLLKLLQQQNQEYQEQQIKNNEILINNIVNGIINHVPSPEENDKLMKVSSQIDNILQEILMETGASRACLVQYHNGVKGINKQSFLKMSMTNEQVQLGIKPMISDFKEQFRSVLSYFVNEIQDTGFCYIDDAESLKEVDSSMYEFLKARNIQAKYGCAIRKDDIIIGFICIEYTDKYKARQDLITQSFENKQKVVETLLSL